MVYAVFKVKGYNHWLISGGLICAALLIGTRVWRLLGDKEAGKPPVLDGSNQARMSSVGFPRVNISWAVPVTMVVLNFAPTPVQRRNVEPFDAKIERPIERLATSTTLLQLSKTYQAKGN